MDSAVHRVLIVNECGSDNIGDRALAYGMHKAFFDDGFIVDMADYSCRSINEHAEPSFGLKGSCNGMKSFLYRICRKAIRWMPGFLYGFVWACYRFRKVLRYSQGNYDLVVLGGGQLILSNRVFPFLIYMWVTLFKFRGAKVFLVAVGVGETFTWLEKMLVKTALKKADGFYVRDNRSIRNSEKIFGIVPRYCPDSAFYLAEDRGRQENANYSPDQERFALVCPVDYDVYVRYANEMSRDRQPTWDSYLAEWQNIINDKIYHGYKVILSSTTMQDHEVARELFRKYNEYEDKVLLAEYSSSYLEFVKLIRKSSIVVSGRMHALILGMTQSKNIEPYYISKKIKGFVDEYRCADVLSLKIEILKTVREINKKMNEKLCVH